MSRAGFLLLAAVVVGASGCSAFGGDPVDPFEGRYWAETEDGWAAICFPGNPERCFQLSGEAKQYFAAQICPPAPDGGLGGGPEDGRLDP